MDMVAWLLIIHAGATLFMVGLIWTIQMVHYPLFAAVGEAEYVAYQREHMRRIGWIVGPVMLTEAAAAVALVMVAQGRVPGMALWFGVGLLLAIWASTAFVQAPTHVRLSKGRDVVLVRKLVRTNWSRTIAWTLRGGLALAMLVSAGP